MVRNTILILLLLLPTLSVRAQEKIKGDRNVTIVETEVNSFKKIALYEKFDIVLIEGTQASVEIETDENLHDVIEFSVIDSVLSFKTNAKIVSSKKMEIKVRYTKDLQEIELKDDAEISALTSLDIDNFFLKTYDNSRAYLNIKSSDFKFIGNGKSKSRLNIESSMTNLELNDNTHLEALLVTDSTKVSSYMRSKAVVEGSSKNLELNAISSSEFMGKNFTVNTCQLTIEDSCDATLNVTDQISINATGNSDVFLYGTGKITMEKFTDSASLQKKEF